MTKAIFATRVTPSYDDRPEDYYHFPKAYLNQVRAAIGDQIIYYEPRRTDSSLSSRGGRQSYFAFAKVDGIREDPNQADHYYADVSNFLPFSRPVRFKEDNFYYEGRLRNEDGSTNLGLARRSVRNISDAEFELILSAGFASMLVEDKKNSAGESGFEEPPVDFERPLMEVTLLRPFRDRAFKFAVRSAYDNKCALTGLRLINGGGRPEVEAAHIKPVAKKGPDSIRNGLALSGTVHWMFDRGLLSVGDDYKILIAKNYVPEEAVRLLNKSGVINLPKDETLFPNAHYLKFHRDCIFKG